MYKYLPRLILLSVVVLSGCNQNPLAPKELARRFQVCHRYQSSDILRPAACKQNTALFSIMTDELRHLSGRLDLGMKIADSQKQLAELQQESAAKGLTTEARQLFVEKIAVTKQRILALQSIFFLVQSL